MEAMPTMLNLSLKKDQVLCVEGEEDNSQNLTEHMPLWMVYLAKAMTRKIRTADELIRNRGIKKQKSEDGIAPLSMDEQGHYFRLIKAKREELGL